MHHGAATALFEWHIVATALFQPCLARVCSIKSTLSPGSNFCVVRRRRASSGTWHSGSARHGVRPSSGSWRICGVAGNGRSDGSLLLHASQSGQALVSQLTQYGVVITAQRDVVLIQELTSCFDSPVRGLHTVSNRWLPVVGATVEAENFVAKDAVVWRSRSRSRSMTSGSRTPSSMLVSCTLGKQRRGAEHCG
jgi:hypothetical protein